MSFPSVRRAALALCLFGLGGCGVNVAPYVAPLDDQSVAVGLELAIQINASDPDGDELTFAVDAPELPDLLTRQPPATLMAYTNGVAIFHWIPTGADVRSEPYELDFTVSDGKVTSGIAVFVNVTPSGGNVRPMFVKPIGSGTTLDLDTTPCLEIAVEVADTDSTMVTIAEESPLVDGGMLLPEGPFSATWKWCPTASDLNGQDRFYLHLSADDGSGQKTVKDPYLIAVIGGSNCPGAAAQITHTPLTDQTTSAPLAVTFTATDDIGVAATPLVYWSIDDPGTPPILSDMTMVTTTSTGGTPTNGTYSGTIPSPVGSAASGDTATLYYVIVARDTDDPTNSCNHTTLSPATGAYQLTVTAP